jgi:hypothetical protein
MEKMLGKSIMGHVLSYQQALIALTAVANQIHQSLMSYLAHLPCLILPKK